MWLQWIVDIGEVDGYEGAYVFLNAGDCMKIMGAVKKIKKIVCLFIVSGLLVVLNTAQGFCTLEITDAAGRNLRLDKLPQRIVVIGSAAFIPLHMIYMFDQAKERLKGFEVKSKKNDAFLALLDPELGTQKKLYSNPGPESVAALKPDLVISKAIVEGSMARSLKALGIPVLYLGAENPDMFLRDIKNLGKVFGDPGRADRIIQYFRGKLSLIRQTVDGVKPEEKPRVLVLEYSNPKVDSGGSVDGKDDLSRETGFLGYQQDNETVL